MENKWWTSEESSHKSSQDDTNICVIISLLNDSPFAHSKEHVEIIRQLNKFKKKIMVEKLKALILYSIFDRQ